MDKPSYGSALIVGTGPGLSASLSTSLPSTLQRPEAATSCRRQRGSAPSSVSRNWSVRA